MAIATGNGHAPGMVPPHDLEAEQCVLGGLLLDQDALARIVGQIEPEDFYRENHGQVYRAALRLAQRSEPIDLVLLAAELEAMGLLERIGGRAQLAMLQEQTPTAANIEHYAQRVRAHSKRRQLAAACRRGEQLAHDAAVSEEEALDKVSSDVHRIALNSPEQAVLVKDGLRAALDRLDRRMSSGAALAGVTTGLLDLNRMTDGMESGELWVVGARPSVGKTAFALNVALAAATEASVPVALFSLEMGQDQLIDRLLCCQARVDGQRYRKGLLSEKEQERVVQATGPLGDAKILIDDRPMLSEVQLGFAARRLQHQHGIGLVIVDYLQLMMPGQRSREGNRVQEVTEVSRSLKALARELKVPVLALSQLSRGVEQRGSDRRPGLADLRESGAIEQDADLVLALFRDDYYNREKSEKPGIAEVLVLKNRNGPTGTVEVRFDRASGRFDNLDKHRV